MITLYTLYNMILLCFCSFSTKEGVIHCWLHVAENLANSESSDDVHQFYKCTEENEPI